MQPDMHELRDSPEDILDPIGGAARLGRVYAEGLFLAAEKQGKAEEMAEQFDSLMELFRIQPDVERLFGSAIVRRARKEQILQNTFGGRADPLFLNFLLVVNRHDRLAYLRSMYRAYHQLGDERAKRVRVKVRSAVELDEGQRQQLTDLLRSRLDREPILQPTVDPSLLGGMIVQVGDEVFDSSVRTRLETLRKQLLARSSYEIQRGRDRFGDWAGT